MTDQVSDGLRVDGVGYDIQSANPGVFSPWDYGIEPQDVCSSNWSGYIAGFEVVDKRLYLSLLSVGYSPPRKRPAERDQDDLEVISGFFDPGPPPALNGVTPEPAGGGYLYYRDVDMPLDYTGRLIGCPGDSGSAGGGTCLEFVFESGILVETLPGPAKDAY